MVLKEIKHIFHKELDALYAKEEVDSFFFMLVEHYLGLERFVLVMEPQKIISKTEEQPLFEGLAQLKQECPIQYILGESFFFDIKLYVNHDVLIPRPETEELVEWVIDQVRNRPDRSVKILDVGTGSGCIAITLAKHLPHAAVYALDVSEKTLQVAKRNAVENKVSITFLHKNVLEIDTLGETFDIIVSNPPYVRELEKSEIKNNVKEYEPELALFVTDKEPLMFYKKISALAMDNLSPGGALYFEINQYLGKEMQQLMQDRGFAEIELRKDNYGNDRMLKGIWKEQG